MIRTAFCALALFGYTQLALAGPNGQEPPTRGSQESSAPVPSSGITLEKQQAIQATYDAWFAPQPVSHGWAYQPYYSGGLYRTYPVNSAYRYPHPFGLAGYYPPRAGGYYRSGWWYW